MATKTKTLSHEAVEVLDSMAIYGNTAAITAGQLDRKLYQEVNAALEALGGKWDRKAKAHVFEGDPRDAIDQVATDGCWHSTKQEFDLFETPKELAERLVDEAGVHGGHTVLEPSAGTGRLLDELYDAGADVFFVEKQRKLAAELMDRGYPGVWKDFLEWDAGGAEFSRIVMNPPFSKCQDVRHVRHAWEMLAPGGRLVSVMGAGVKFRQSREHAAFREFVDENGRMEDLPEKSFHASGTDVNTVMVVLEKRGAGEDGHA